MKKIYDTSSLGEDRVSKLVLGLIVPRPIGWISTVGSDGIYNLAPFSFFNAVCDYPPVFIVSISDRDEGEPKDTVKNILETEEFTINIVTEELVNKMKITSEEFPTNVDEFKEAKLRACKGIAVKSPYVEESPVNIECKLLDYKRVYDMHLLFGEGINFIIDENILDDNWRVNYNKLRPIGRLAGRLYIKAFGDSILEVE